MKGIHRETCPDCNGEESRYFTCCNVEVDEGDFENDLMLCPKCKEWNEINECKSVCETCNGEGIIEKIEEPDDDPVIIK